MSKKLNEEMLGSELKASAFFTGARTKKAEPSPTLPGHAAAKDEMFIPAPPIKIKIKPKPKAAPLPKPDLPEKPVDQPADASTTQSTAESTKPQAIDQSVILGRPKAFYITEKQDRDLDSLVAQISQRLGGKLLFKIDRSVLMRLILESSDLTTDETIKRLSTRLISRSISQLTG